MPDAFLLSRALLRLTEDGDKSVTGNLSSIALDPEGNLWLGGDEGTTIERLTPVEPLVFGQHRSFAVGEYLDLFDKDEEIDIEGMDFSDGYLWLIGSHSTTRKQPKGKSLEKDLEKLATVRTALNRYLLGRIPLQKGEPVRECAGPGDSSRILKSATLEKAGEGNLLLELLKDDPHLGEFLKFKIPSKENGIDIEGLAVRGNHLFIGLRGPVLRGWAIILHVKVEEKETGQLTFADLKNERKYYKHFVDLNGLGIRELCLLNDDLLILAGPTMDLQGRLTLFRLQDARGLKCDTVNEQDSKDLELVFDLPFVRGADHAEGLALCSCLGKQSQLLIVYDSPAPERLSGNNAVYADIFSLELD